jgi:hypothetical protein
MIGRAIDLAAHAHHVRVIGILEVDGEVIEDVAVRPIGAPLPAANTDRPNRMATHRPVGDVDVVDVCSTM